MSTSEKPSEPVRPLDPPMVPFAVGGMVAWALAGLVLLLAHGESRWLWTCLAGLLFGIPGLLVMLRHDANRRRRRQAPGPQVANPQSETGSTSLSS